MTSPRHPHARPAFALLTLLVLALSVGIFLLPKPVPEDAVESLERRLSASYSDLPRFGFNDEPPVVVLRVLGYQQRIMTCDVYALVGGAQATRDDDQRWVLAIHDEVTPVRFKLQSGLRGTVAGIDGAPNIDSAGVDVPNSIRPSVRERNMLQKQLQDRMRKQYGVVLEWRNHFGEPGS